jgi:hypothetical protein
MELLERWQGAIASALGVVSLACSGCAHQVELSAWEAAGWRSGWVRQVVNGNRLQDVADVVCAKTMAPDQIGHQSFAVVMYLPSIGARWRRSLIVPIPVGLALRPGDEVTINIRDCGRSMALAGG